MIRIIVETCDAGIAANVGGSVETTFRTFDVILPELEAFLRQPEGPPKWSYSHRRVKGVEVLPATPKTGG